MEAGNPPWWGRKKAFVCMQCSHPGVPGNVSFRKMLYRLIGGFSVTLWTLCHRSKDQAKHLNRPQLKSKLCFVIAANSLRPSAEACILSAFS